MEPRSFDRGDPWLNELPVARGRASMEPRSFDRGDGPRPDGPRPKLTRFNGAAVF